MAYYDFGRSSTNQAERERNFREAERWLNLARESDRTMSASDYNLGRIAFETRRYEEAAMHFERLLLRDPNNVMALRAAAYSRIMNGDLLIAESLYSRVLALVPESADDGFNHALVLFSIGHFERAEELLFKYPHALEQNPSSRLLLARSQKAQGKIEAIDNFDSWMEIANPPGPLGLYEFAAALENAGFYVRALEKYDLAQEALRADTERISFALLLFVQGRVLLIADPDSNDGFEKLSEALEEGFSDIVTIQQLLADERIRLAARNEARLIFSDLLN
jgi:tetratricopeptide (TPR) repeat protein